MKKKLVILCIAAAMSVSMLGGCGNSAKTTDSTKTEGIQQKTVIRRQPIKLQS